MGRPSIQDPYIYIHSNIKGTTQLLELSHRHDVKNFVFASSSSVYGGSKSTYFSEEEAVEHPVSPYAASKKACELMAYTYHHLYKPIFPLSDFSQYMGLVGVLIWPRSSLLIVLVEVWKFSNSEMVPVVVIILTFLILWMV